MKRKAGGELKDQRNDWEGGAERKRRKAAPTFRKKERGAARYSPYRQRLRPSAPGSLRREFIGADSATCIRYPARLNLRPQRWPREKLHREIPKSPVHQRGRERRRRIGACRLDFRWVCGWLQIDQEDRAEADCGRRWCN